MASPLSDGYLDNLGDLVAKTTPGTWKAVYDGDWQVEIADIPSDAINYPRIAVCSDGANNYAEERANACFIEVAHVAVPALIAEVRTLRRQVEQPAAGHKGE